MKHDDKDRSATESLGYIAGAGFGMTRSMMRGKALSTSIIVLAAAILILGGSFIQHSDTKLFVQVVGCIFAVIGRGGWFVSLQEK